MRSCRWGGGGQTTDPSPAGPGARSLGADQGGAWLWGAGGGEATHQDEQANHLYRKHLAEPSSSSRGDEKSPFFSKMSWARAGGGRTPGENEQAPPAHAAPLGCLTQHGALGLPVLAQMARLYRFGGRVLFHCVSVDHIFFICPSVGGHLGCFCILAV